MPEISPELAARIESLRASHAENPARFFMPLASAYREGGDVARAEELLRENLKRHPGYLSAHVLLGRCLADRGAHAEARNEFQYVLSVDSQNLIALRSLGDMAAAGGDPGEARRWYGELLAVDPMNTEAKHALAGLEAAPPAAAEGSEAGGFGMVDPDEAGPAADHPAAHADPGSWGEVSLANHPAFSAGNAPAEGEPAPASFDALEFGAVDLSGTGDSADAPDAAPAHEDSAAAPGSFAEAPPADAWGALDDGQDAVDADGVEPLQLEEFYGGASDLAPAAHGDEHEEHPEEHEEVVTETIAELYARQGFPERAAGVYRELIARRGEEPALVRRLAELDGQLAAAPPADAGAFDPVDLPLESADDSSDWLRTVDSVVAGESPAPAPAASDDNDDDDGLMDLGTVDFAPAEEMGFDAPPAAAEQDSGFADFAPVDFAPSDADFGAPPAAAAPEAGWVDFGTVDFDGSADAGSAASGDASAAEVAAPSADGSTGDAFADSFANGFDAGAAEAPRAEWEAPRVEETAPIPELESAAADAAAETVAAESAEVGSVESAEAESAGAESAEIDVTGAGESTETLPFAAESPAQPAGRTETIAAYLSSILSWRPGARAGTAAVETDAAAPPPARPWDDETLGASDEQPPIDEPWIAPDAPAAEAPASAEPVADEPWAGTSSGAGDAAPADEPWAAADAEPAPWADAPAAEPQSEPWADAGQPELEPEDDGGDLPWLSSEVGATETPAQPEPAVSEPTDGPMPWETSFDLSPEVPDDAPAERPAPRQEPTAGAAGGFSFEDFFSEPVASPAPAAMPEPLPEPAAAPPSAAQPPAAGQGGEEDEDLESFQAWLQSLKR